MDHVDEPGHRTGSPKKARVQPWQFMRKRFYRWERFPYPYMMRARQMTRWPSEVREFYEKYHEENIMQTTGFFNFCKSAVLEYSPSFKEELHRQEALIRLFCGIYRVSGIGAGTALILTFAHAIASLVRDAHLGSGILAVTGIDSGVILLACLFVVVGLGWVRRQILEQLRFMRVRELDLAFDAFYFISKRHELEFSHPPNLDSGHGDSDKPYPTGGQGDP